MTKLHGLAALGLTLIAPVSLAQGTDPAAKKLLGEVAQAYRNLTSCSFTMDTVIGAGPSARKISTKISMKKPGDLSAEVHMATTVTHMVFDGTSAYADSSTDKTKYAKVGVSSLNEAFTVLRQSGGAGVGLLPILMTSAHLETQLFPQNPSSVKRGADAKVGSESCDVIDAVIPGQEGASLVEFAFGKQDHLLRKLSLGPVQASAPREEVETYSNIDLHPTFVASTFTYTPQPGATVAVAPPQRPAFDPRIKVGAMPIPIGGADLAGKTVSLDQFKGKVLMLDFWATWCGPCVGELPNVIAAYGKYHSKGFEIVGISLDQPNSKDKVEKFIADKKMPWQQIYAGKFWEADNAVAYGVQSIPFTVLIGRDGKIAAVGARGEELAPAVEAALAQK